MCDDTRPPSPQTESALPDDAFARDLRERLVGSAPRPIPPVEAAARTSVSPTVGAPAAAPAWAARAHRRLLLVVWVLFAVALVAALIAVVALSLPR